MRKKAKKEEDLFVSTTIKGKGQGFISIKTKVNKSMMELITSTYKLMTCLLVITIVVMMSLF